MMQAFEAISVVDGRTLVHCEDESLVGEMVEELSRERGALPMLAFAAARLRRDAAALREFGPAASAPAEPAQRRAQQVAGVDMYVFSAGAVWSSSLTSIWASRAAILA